MRPERPHLGPQLSLFEEADGAWFQAISTITMTAAAIAADVVTWTRMLALTGGAKSLTHCEPNTLRYRLLHVPHG